MNELTLASHAKINLTLDVGAKRPEDGYHYVRLVMLPISLADTLRLRPAPEVSVACTPDIAGHLEGNLAYRAARLLKDVTGYPGGAAIELNKVIPVAGGLAGGSTNAAAVLKGLNQLWGTGLSEDELVHLGIRLGSDVPFFIPCQPARVEGIGERLTPIRVKRQLWFALATPDVAKSTGNVFRLFDELTEVERPDNAAMEAALAQGDLAAIAAALGNVFEPVMLPRHPEIGRLKAAMLEAGALGALMSGAGPTVFGLVESEEAGRKVLAAVQPLAVSAFLVSSVGHGG